MTIDNNDIPKGGKHISNWVHQYTIIIYIRTSSEVTITTTFPRGNHKGKNPAKFLKILSSLRQYHKMEKPKHKKSSATLSLSSCELEWVSVCINEGGRLPIYILQVIDFLTWLGWLLTLAGPTSPRETPKIHFIILNWGLLPQLTTKVVPQGPQTIMTFRKEGNTSLMGV